MKKKHLRVNRNIWSIYGNLDSLKIVRERGVKELVSEINLLMGVKKEKKEKKKLNRLLYNHHTALVS